MDKLVDYFIAETNKKHEETKLETKLEFEKVHKRLDDLSQFKMQLIVSSRVVSLIVSIFCGFVTLVVSTYVAIAFR